MTRKLKKIILVSSLGILITSLSLFAVHRENEIILTDNNFSILLGPLTNESANDIILDMLELDKKRDNKSSDLFLVIKTSGGDVGALARLYETLKTIKNLKIISFEASSAGFMLANMLSGERLAIETASFMIHPISIGELKLGGPINRVEAFLNGLLVEQETYDTIIAKRLGLSLTEYQEWRKIDVYLNTEQALKLNVIDKVVSVKCDETAINKIILMDSFMNFLGVAMPIKISVSKCPLLN